MNLNHFIILRAQNVKFVRSVHFIEDFDSRDTLFTIFMLLFVYLYIFRRPLINLFIKTFQKRKIIGI